MTTRTPREGFAEALAACNRANDALLEGRSGPLKDCFSHGEDVSLFGGFGGHERGWRHLEPRLDWVARSFAGGRCDYETIATGAGDELGFTVQIERIEARVVGQASPVRMDLRVTMVFRFEASAWKLLHRHADHLLEKRAPT